MKYPILALFVNYLFLFVFSKSISVEYYSGALVKLIFDSYEPLSTPFTINGGYYENGFMTNFQISLNTTSNTLIKKNTTVDAPRVIDYSIPLPNDITKQGVCWIGQGMFESFGMSASYQSTPNIGAEKTITLISQTGGCVDVNSGLPTFSSPRSMYNFIGSGTRSFVSSLYDYDHCFGKISGNNGETIDSYSCSCSGTNVLSCKKWTDTTVVDCSGESFETIDMTSCLGFEMGNYICTTGDSHDFGLNAYDGHRQRTENYFYYFGKATGIKTGNEEICKLKYVDCDSTTNWCNYKSENLMKKNGETEVTTEFVSRENSFYKTDTEGMGNIRYVSNSLPSVLGKNDVLKITFQGSPEEILNNTNEIQYFKNVGEFYFNDYCTMENVKYICEDDRLKVNHYPSANCQGEPTKYLYGEEFGSMYKDPELTTKFYCGSGVTTKKIDFVKPSVDCIIDNPTNKGTDPDIIIIISISIIIPLVIVCCCIFFLLILLILFLRFKKKKKKNQVEDEGDEEKDEELKEEKEEQ